MTGEQAIQYIHSCGYSAAPRMAVSTELMHALGDPQESLSCIHIAGTNGKGSTSAMLDSILRAAGYRVGLFTSPYIRKFRERIRVGGELIDKDDLGRITDRVRAVSEHAGLAPTEFEVITAVAFSYFQEKGVDLVVLEVGLGGRFDPTNVIKTPVLSIITGIDFDHTALLGNTIQEIAAEKAGIIKEGRPCIYGGGENAACRTIRALADRRHAPFYTVDRSSYHLVEATLDGTVFDYADYTALHLPLLGSYQPYNATLVLSAVEILKGEGYRIPEEAVREGLADTRWQARFELLSRDPAILYDGGHNPEGVMAAVKSVQLYFPEQQINILSGVMTDKDVDGMVETIKPIARRVFTVTPGNPRALSATEYASEFSEHKIVADAYPSVVEGLRAAIADCRENSVPLLCLGSLYLYRELTDALEEITE